jgi:hypothetical protein
VAVPAIGPYHHGKQGWAALLDGGQHLVPAQGVEGVLPVHLHGDAGRDCSHVGAESVPDDLAAPANANGDLQWGQGVAGFRISGQGAEGGGLYQTLPTAMGWMPPDGLGKGRRRRRGGGVEEAASRRRRRGGGVQEAVSRRRGRLPRTTAWTIPSTAARASSLLLVAALMCLYVQPMGPAAGL